MRATMALASVMLALGGCSKESSDAEPSLPMRPASIEIVAPVGAPAVAAAPNPGAAFECVAGAPVPEGLTVIESEDRQDENGGALRATYLEAGDMLVFGYRPQGLERLAYADGRSGVAAYLATGSDTVLASIRARFPQATQTGDVVRGEGIAGELLIGAAQAGDGSIITRVECRQ